MESMESIPDVSVEIPIHVLDELDALLENEFDNLQKAALVPQPSFDDILEYLMKSDSLPTQVASDQDVSGCTSYGLSALNMNVRANSNINETNEKLQESKKVELIEPMQQPVKRFYNDDGRCIKTGLQQTNMMRSDRKRINTDKENQFVHQGPLRSNTVVPYRQCPICALLSSNKHVHYRHLLLDHQLELKPHKCELCKKMFCFPVLQTKLSQLHSEPEYFECELCKKEHQSEYSLKRHKETHYDVCPLLCKVCKLTPVRPMKETTNLR